MKKSLTSVMLLLGAAFILPACSTRSGNQSGEASDAHTSRNSLDWTGVYTADSALLILRPDQTYLLERKVSADSIARSKGTFSWDSDGKNIRLPEINTSYWIREENVVPLGNNDEVLESAALAKEKTELTGVYWKLTEINGKSLDSFQLNPGREAHLRFDAAKSMVSGNSGCNQIFGPYESGGSPGKILFKNLGSTMMMCISAMDLEQEFTATIKQVAQYELRNGTLVLSDAGGKALFRFSRALPKSE